jgi:NAD(P)-dependent dehydrogenase (short-subunit alcohol dehydrogenase family)
MAEVNMQGRVCLVTGSSSGIGKVTARELARMGATVVMVCRNQAKGEAAQAEIKTANGNNEGDLIVSSMAHTSGKIDFADLQGEKKYRTWKAYSQAKLALILFTYERARQQRGTNVTINALSGDLA